MKSSSLAFDIIFDIIIIGTMTKQEKLLTKLKAGHIDARELRTLLVKLGWSLDRTKGSHEFWERGTETFVLATHSDDLKPYQKKQAKEALLKEEPRNVEEKG